MKVKRSEEVSLKRSKSSKFVATIILTVVMVMVIATAVFAEGETPQLSIDFDVAEMFSWTQIITDSLMPVVYVVMGLGLGFLIVNNLKRAFMGSVH